MEFKFTHLPDISTIQPERLIKYRVSEDRFSAEVLLPGFSYTDFDQKIGGTFFGVIIWSRRDIVLALASALHLFYRLRNRKDLRVPRARLNLALSTRKVSLWSLAKLCETARSQALIHGLIYFSELYRENTMFVASQSIHLSEEFSDIRYGRQFGEKRPLKVIIYICNVGKTSFTVVVDLFDKISGLKLATNLIVWVNIDRNLRKPTALPKRLYANLDKHLKDVDHHTIDRADLPTIPDDALRYDIKCVHSDSDTNRHITQAAYLKYCSDAASMGALKGHFSQLKRHIELYPLKLTEFHYIGEALVNDMIVVNVWEESDSFRTLQFAITRKGKIIFILKMEFYDGSPAAVSPHLKSKL